MSFHLREFLIFFVCLVCSSLFYDDNRYICIGKLNSKSKQQTIQIREKLKCDKFMLDHLHKLFLHIIILRISRIILQKLPDLIVNKEFLQVSTQCMTFIQSENEK